MATDTSYLTITSRSFIVPELGVTLRFDSIEPPEEAMPLLKTHDNGLSQRDSDALDDLLEEICQQIFQVPSSNILSFSRWREMTSQLRYFFNHDAERLLVGSSDQADRPGSERWLQQMRLRSSMLERYQATEQFVGTYLTNSVLNPLRSRTVASDPFGISRYVSDAGLIDRLYEFLPGDVSEVDMHRWAEVSSSLTSRTPKPAVLASQTLDRYQLPLPGSPPVRLLTLEQFKRFCYGAASVLIGASTYNAISHPTTDVLACILGGAAPALVLVTTGSVSEFLDNYLNGKAAKENRSKRRLPQTKRRAA